MNLHAIVRGAINANHADETFTWFRSLGQQNIEGLMQNTYADGVEIKGSFQSEGDSTLDHSNLAGQNSLIRKLYVFADNDAQMRPYALYRPLARTGDYIVDKYNAYRFVVAVEEDF